MPATVNVNFLTVVHAASNGVSICFPDVCKTPTPAGPVPIPYPNIAMSKDTSQGSTTVKMDGNPIMLKGSVYATSTGDEAGSVGGVVSNVIKGKAEFLNYSFDVKVEGKNVPRLLDPMGQNESSPQNGVSPANLQPPTVVINVPKQVAQKKLLSARVTKVEFKSGIKLWTTDKQKRADEEIPPAGEPHWEAGRTKKYPACYVRDGTSLGSTKRDVKVVVEITTELSGEATLTARRMDVEITGKANVSPSKTAVGVIFNCKCTKLPPTAALCKHWEFNWELELAGQKRKLNSTLLTLFIVDEEPKPVAWPGSDGNHNWYDWVLEYSCHWAGGQTGADKVFAAIWKKFSTGTAARVPHETGWSYWKTGLPIQVLRKCPFDAEDQGWSCRAIAHYFMMAVAAHGLTCKTVIPVGSKGSGFVVAEWDLSGIGGQTGLAAWGYLHYYGGEWEDTTPPKEKPDRAGLTRDATRNAHVAQGQSNPPLVFSNHWIVEMGSGPKGIYDTSYGGARVAKGSGVFKLDAYKKVAISGWMAASFRPFVIAHYDLEDLTDSGADASN